VAEISDSLGQRAQADDGLGEGRLARAVGPEQGDLLAAFDDHIDGAHERPLAHAGADDHRGGLQLEHDARRRRRLRQAQVEPARIARRRLHVTLDSFDLSELGLGLLGLQLLGVKAIVEALELLDLVFVLFVTASGELVAGGAFAHVGGKVASDGGHRAVLEGQHSRAHALQQPAVGVTST